MKSSAKRTAMHLVIALVIGIVLAVLIKPTNGLTDIGLRVVVVTIPTLYLWLTLNTHWTSILFMGLLVMTGAMSPNEVWAGSMGHFSVISMIVFMVMNFALTETGVIDRVCSWFITRKIVKNRPFVFISMFFASMLVLGMFMDNLSLAVIYVGIAQVLAKKIGLEKGESFYTCMFMGIMWVDVVISIASPIAHAPCLILMSMINAQLGVEITYGQWLALGIPFAIIMFVVIVICVRFWNPDTSKFVNYDVEAELANAKKLDIRGIISAVVFIIMLAMMLIPELTITLLPGFAGYWKGVGVIVVAILAVSVLCAVHIDDKPILDMPSALKTLPMGAIIFAGVVCVMSTPITSELTGINVWMSNTLQPLISGISPWLVVVILAVAALIMTNFLSNVVTMTLFFNIGVVLLGGGSIHLGMYAMIVGFAAAMATLTPAACAPMPLIFGPGHVTMKNTIRPNLLFVILAIIVIFAYMIPIAPMIIGPMPPMP